MIAYRYSINDGDFGGIVFALNEDEAMQKLQSFYKTQNLSAQIWKWEDDDFYRPVPDVYECY